MKIRDLLNIMEEIEKSVPQSNSSKVEAWGYYYNKKDQRVFWSKVFNSKEDLDNWEKRTNATVLGTKNIG